MGQHVGVFQNIRWRESKNQIDSGDDILYLTRKGQETQKDVTQNVVNSNSNSNEQFEQTSFSNEPNRKDESTKVDSCQDANNLHSKIIPKKAWTGYQLVHLQQHRESISKKPPPTRLLVKSPNTMNSIYTNIVSNNTSQPIQISDDIEQLITMMKNHRVSDDSSGVTHTTTSPILNTCDFNFSNGNSNTTTKLLTPQHTPPPSATLNSLPEFKFSFPAHSYHIPSATLDSLKISSNTPTLQLLKPPSEVAEKNAETKKNYDARINARKILPLPKPRIRKSEDNNTTSNIPSLSTAAATTFRTPLKEDPSSDRDNSKKKLKCSKDTEKIVVVDNKRKERNWKDASVRVEPKSISTFTTTTTITKTDKNTSQRTSKLVLNSTTTTITVPPPPPPTVTATNNKKTAEKKPSPTKKKGKQLNNNNNEIKSKKKGNNKPKKAEDMAPGGFLSSDVTLFDNPISDDWICLFCQYDILFSGYKETKKKNSRRRKKNNNAKGKKVNDHTTHIEGSSISSGSSASDDDHVL